MSDLDTLLRDAGREPTIDLDVDEVATRGHRRTVGRRVAAGAGALAVVGALAVGLPAVLGDTRPSIDIGPVDSPTTGAAADVDAAIAALLELPAEPGSSTALNLTPQAVADAARIDIVESAPDVSAELLATTRHRGGADPLGGQVEGVDAEFPVVATDGAIWGNDADGALVRAAGPDGTPAPIVGVDSGVGLVPVDVGPDGSVLTLTSVPAGEEPQTTGRTRLVRVTPDGATSDVVHDLDGAFGMPAPIRDAHATSRGTAVLVDTPADGPAVGFVAPDGTTSVVRQPVDPQDVDAVVPVATVLVGDDVWVLEQSTIAQGETEQRVLRIAVVPTAGGDTTVFDVPTVLVPDADPTVMSVDPDGRVVLLGFRDPVTDELSTLGVFPTVFDLVADPSATVRIIDAVGSPRASLAAAATAAATAAPVDEPAPDDDLASVPDDAPLAATTGRDVTRVLGGGDQPVRVRRTTVNGSGDAPWVAAADGSVGTPVVTQDGAVWFLAGDGRTVRVGPGGEVSSVRAEDGLAWQPVGIDGDRVLVTEQVIGDGILSGGEPRLLTLDAAVTFEELAGIDLADGLDGDQSVFAAAMAAETLVVATNAGESYRVVAYLAGAGTTTVFQTGGFDAWILDVALHGSTVSVLEATDGGRTSVLHRIDLAGGADPSTLTLTSSPGGVDGPAVGIAPVRDTDLLLVDVATADGPATRYGLTVPTPITAGALDEIADTVIEGPGIVRLTRPLPADVELATCATEDGERINGAPGIELAVWWLCSDATAALPDGVAYPFWRAERFQGAAVVDDVSGIMAVLRVWAAGPGGDLATRGVTGGLDEEVATIAGVTLDGTIAVVDVASGARSGVLGPTYASGAFTSAVVGAVLQFDGYGGLAIDGVQFTLDGSCADWKALVEDGGVGCRTYDVEAAPWVQFAGG